MVQEIAVPQAIEGAQVVSNLARPVGRLAPSPTGTLHLGNARSFLLAWLSIRQQKGTVILRIEDIDTSRIKPGSVQSAMDDLRWLGLDWDFGPDLYGGLLGDIPVTQSLRLDRYREVLKSLINDGQVYRCSCSRSQIAMAAASAPHELSLNQLDGPIYPGTCRNLPWNRYQFQFSDQDSAALRWAFQPGEIHWCDQLLGSQSANPTRQLGDFVLGRANGQPSYQLAVVVDDHDMAVTEVVRGQDLVASTFRQIAILQHLKWSVPHYCHVPLVLDSQGRRMSKREGDSLSYLRSRHVRPEAVIGSLAYSLQLIGRPHEISARELIGTLSWQRLPIQATRLSDHELL